jgi:hypothetical protein
MDLTFRTFAEYVDVVRKERAARACALTGAAASISHSATTLSHSVRSVRSLATRKGDASRTICSLDRKSLFSFTTLALQ